MTELILVWSRLPRPRPAGLAPPDGVGSRTGAPGGGGQAPSGAAAPGPGMCRRGPCHRSPRAAGTATPGQSLGCPVPPSPLPGPLVISLVGDPLLDTEGLKYTAPPRRVPGPSRTGWCSQRACAWTAPDPRRCRKGYTRMAYILQGSRNRQWY